MKKTLSTIVLFLAFYSVSFCQAKKVDDGAKSKTELFTEKSGSMIKKEFIDLEKIGPVKFQILKLTDVLTNVTTSGLRLEGPGRSSSKTAFLDADEVDGLIKSIAYINASVLNTAPPANDVEYNFRARSGFAAGVFNYENKWNAYLKLERYDSDSQYSFSLENFVKIKALLESAKSKL